MRTVIDRYEHSIVVSIVIRPRAIASLRTSTYESDFSPAIFVTTARRCTCLRARVMATIGAIPWEITPITRVARGGISLALQAAAVISNSI